ncbi:MAG: chromate transporter [Oscillospiraceae bacterium]|nr:chromate transporter [Oscillospiraceae bacterium]
MEQLPEKKKPPYGRLFASMFVISACTFGGGFVIVSLMKKKFVEQYHWLSAEQMLDMTAIAQSSPGAIAVNAALQVGFYLGGGPAAAVAVLGTVLPPVVLLSVISLVYAAFRDSLIVATLLQGMQLGVGAVLLDVTCGLAKPLIKKRDWLAIGIMLTAFVLSWVLKINVMYIVLGTALLGVLRAVLAAKKSGGGQRE